MPLERSENGYELLIHMEAGGMQQIFDAYYT